MDQFYTIIPLNVGILDLGKDHVLGDEYSADDRIEFAQISFLIQGNGKKVLVDLGCKTLEYSNEMFRRFGFFRTMPDGSTPDDIRQPEGNVLDQLARMGIGPEEITDVIFTHLHADHHGMDSAKDGGMCEDFPNAVFHISKKGWDFNLSQRVDDHWNSYLDWGFGDCMLRKQAEGRMIAHDDVQIATGLDVVYLGGHSPCSQGVRVVTSDGTILIGSDDFYQYQLLEKGIIGRLYTTMDKMIESNGLLADLAISGMVIVPVHDSTVCDLYKQYGEDWVKQAKMLSYRAGMGFRSVRPRRSC